MKIIRSCNALFFSFLYTITLAQDCGVQVPISLGSVYGVDIPGDKVKKYLHDLRDCYYSKKHIYQQTAVAKIPLNFIVLWGKESYNVDREEAIASKLYQSVIYANKAFESARMEFYVLNKIQFYSNKNLNTTTWSYTNPYPSQFYQSLLKPNAINVIIVDQCYIIDMYLKVFPAGGFAYYPWVTVGSVPSNHPDIVALGFRGLGDQYDLAHELGHYFGLLHTHNENGGPWQGGRELMSNTLVKDASINKYVYSNCGDAADYLCSTESNPGMENEAYYFSPFNCSLKREVLKEWYSKFSTVPFKYRNEFGNPDESYVDNYIYSSGFQAYNFGTFNIMSYIKRTAVEQELISPSGNSFWKSIKTTMDCQTGFTEEQLGIMVACLYNNRDYLLTQDVYETNDISIKKYSVSGPTMIRTTKDCYLLTPTLANEFKGNLVTDIKLDIRARKTVKYSQANLEVPDIDEVIKIQKNAKDVLTLPGSARIRHGGEMTPEYLRALSGLPPIEGKIRNEYLVESSSVLNNKEIIVQNYFSPNGDGNNDNFSIKKLAEMDRAFEKAQLSIYNRWGNTVWQSIDEYKEDWSGNTQDGETLPDGVYYYRIESLIDPSKVKAGFVEVMRE